MFPTPLTDIVSFFKNKHTSFLFIYLLQKQDLDLKNV